MSNRQDVCICLAFVSRRCFTALCQGRLAFFCCSASHFFSGFRKAIPSGRGAALIFCAVKPHLFLPFGLVLILWILEHKQYRMLAGLSSALAAASAFAFWFDPNAWPQWLKMMRSMQVAE